MPVLGSIALDKSAPLDLRYTAFTSLERAGPNDQSIAVLRTLADDETLGRTARSTLLAWRWLRRHLMTTTMATDQNPQSSGRAARATDPNSVDSRPSEDWRMLVHDLRNTVATVNGYAELLRRRAARGRFSRPTSPRACGTSRMRWRQSNGYSINLAPTGDPIARRHGPDRGRTTRGWANPARSKRTASHYRIAGYSSLDRNIGPSTCSASWPTSMTMR